MRSRSDMPRGGVQVQHALMVACMLDLKMSAPEVAGLWRAAAEEERREALFGPLATP